MLKPKFYITQKCRQKLPVLKSCIIMNSHEQSILELQVGGRYHIETNPLICGGRYHIETSPFVCGANQWTGFYMIKASVMKELR